MLRNALMNSAAVFAVANEGGDSAAVAAPAANVSLAILKDETKIEAINSAMNAREAFPTFAEAYAKLEAAAEATENFFGLPIAIKGLDAEGNMDESFYAGGQAILAYVGGRVEQPDGKGKMGIKSIVIYAAPTLDSFLASEDGRAYLAKTLEKETALVAFRGFRNALTTTEFLNGVAASPATVADYLTEHERSGNGLDTATFDKLWNGFRLGLKKQNPALSALLPAKGEIIKAIRSKSYADNAKDSAGNPLSALESKNVFVWLASILINAAATYIDPKTKQAAPLDATAIKNWVAGRAELNLELPKEADAKDFSILDSMADMFGTAGLPTGDEAATETAKA